MKFNLDHLLYKFNGQGKPDPDIVHNSSIRSRRIHIKSRTFIIAFAVLVALIAVVSVATIFRESTKPEVTDVVSTEEQQTTAVVTTSLNTNFLFGFSSSSSDNLMLLAVVSVNTDENQLAVKYIPLNTVAEIDGQPDTLYSHFNQGGISRIQQALQNRLDLACARYAFSTEDGLIDIFKHLGEVELTIDENIEYTFEGIDIVIESGTRNFNADMLMKYFCYLCENIDSNTELFTQMLKLVSSIFFDEENPNRFADTFSSVVNSVSTDFSSLDIQNYLSLVNSIYNSGLMDEMTVEQYDTNI